MPATSPKWLVVGLLSGAAVMRLFSEPASAPAPVTVSPEMAAVARNIKSDRLWLSRIDDPGQKVAVCDFRSGVEYWSFYDIADPWAFSGSDQELCLMLLDGKFGKRVEPTEANRGWPIPPRFIR